MYAFRVTILVLLVGLLDCTQAPVIKTIPYKVLNSSSYKPYKTSYDVLVERVGDRLPNESELAAISRVHKAKTQKIFVVFYLPGMEVDAGGFATAHHVPELEVKILTYHLLL